MREENMSQVTHLFWLINDKKETKKEISNKIKRIDRGLDESEWMEN
jgi:hypothetical protein